jgi:hypothetical protein
MALGLWDWAQLAAFVEAFPVPAIFTLLMALFFPLALALALSEQSARRLTKEEVDKLAQWAADDKEVCCYISRVQQIGHPLTKMFFTPVEDYIRRLEAREQRDAAESGLREIYSKCASD